MILDLENIRANAGNGTVSALDLPDISVQEVLDYEETLKQIDDDVIAVENLSDIASVVREDGINDTLKQLFDANGRFSEQLGVTFDEEHKDEVLTELDNIINAEAVTAGAELVTTGGETARNVTPKLARLKSWIGKKSKAAWDAVSKAFSSAYQWATKFKPKVPGVITAHPFIAGTIAAVVAVAAIATIVVKMSKDIAKKIAKLDKVGAATDDGLGSSGKFASSSDMKSAQGTILKGMTMLSKDIGDGFEKTKPEDYKKIMDDLGFERSGNKYKGSFKISREKGTLSDLGWTVKSVNDMKDSIVKSGGKLDDIAGGLDDAPKKVAASMDKVADAVDKAEPKEGASNDDDEKKIKSAQDEGRAVGSAVKRLMGAFEELVDEATKIAEAATK